MRSLYGKVFVKSLLSEKKAFTLAEVLVTLAIIGVVSAMTVPTLMQNHQRKTYVTQLHKVYNELSQALLKYQNDKNAVNLKEAGLTSNTALDNFISEYFNVVQTCDAVSECFADEYKDMSGAVYNIMQTDLKSFVLASGAAIRPNYALSGDKLVNVMVDTNGKSGPNIHGRDLFFMFIYNNGMIDDRGTSAPLTEDQRDSSYNSRCAAQSDIGGCFGKILNDNWEMNY